jgi:hypothetical protein
MANRIDQNAGSGSTPQRPGGAADQDGNADPGLRQAVERAVPAAEKLPGRGADNPITRQVEDAVDERDPKPGRSPLQGGDQPE